MDVYADLLFLINFSMDFLCLFLSVKLLHLRQVTWRMLLAAALGGVYSVLALFLEVSSLVALAIDVGACVGMCAVCVAGKGVRVPRLLLFCGTYFGISALMGGGMTAIYQMEQLPLPIMILLHGGGLYVAYILTYLLNGWLQNALVPILAFTGIFVAGYALIWLLVYFAEKAKAEKLNKLLMRK